MLRTKLYDTHVKMGARMVEFGGWEMPVQYPTGPLAEHHAVRKNAGLFDIAHMGRVKVTGPDALAYLQHLVTWDVSKINVGESSYSLLCYADGGFVDDIFIYRYPEYYLVVINASNRKKDIKWLQLHTPGYNVYVDDVSEELYMLALQGPKAQEILQKLTDHDLESIGFHECTETEVAGVPTLVSRTGYTGEDGFELIFPSEKAEDMWNTILETGKPFGLLAAGLAARDSLRFEACLPLYGQEIHAEIDPISARLGYFVRFEKGDFIGRDAILKVKLEGAKKKLVGFEMVDKGVPRHGYEIADADGNVIGEVTTGMFAPTVGKFLGMGYVPASYAKLDTEFYIVIRGKARKAKVVKRPFYKPRYKK
jgi:aminomethyltransferase